MAEKGLMRAGVGKTISAPPCASRRWTLLALATYSMPDSWQRTWKGAIRVNAYAGGIFAAACQFWGLAGRRLRLLARNLRRGWKIIEHTACGTGTAFVKLLDPLESLR